MKFSTTHAGIYVEKYNTEDMEKIWILNCYKNEIRNYNEESGKLLEKAMSQKIKIKKKKLPLKLIDSIEFCNTVMKLLKCCAIVKTYQLFLINEILPTIENNEFFTVKREEYYQELLITFLLNVLEN